MSGVVSLVATGKLIESVLGSCNKFSVSVQMSTYLQAVMIFAACSSLLFTQRVIWLKLCASPTALSSLICTIALRIVAACWRTSDTKAGSSKMPQGLG